MTWSRLLALLDPLSPGNPHPAALAAGLGLARLLARLWPGRPRRLAFRELASHAQAYRRFKLTGPRLGRRFAGLRLPAQVAAARKLGPFPGLWTVEGLGWARADDPSRKLFDDPTGRDLPPGSLVPLHTGLGLALAHRLLREAGPDAGQAELAQLVDGFASLCRRVSLPGCAGAALEGLGFAARIARPELVPGIGRAVEERGPELAHRFWHGLGRGLYFAHLPRALHHRPEAWPAVAAARREPTYPSGRRNALAGLAWPLLLVNLRQPAVLEAFLRCHHHELAEDGAFARGVTAALLTWHAWAGRDLFFERLMEHRPEAGLDEAWRRQVAEPGAAALGLAAAFAASRRAGELFTDRPIDELAESLRLPATGAEVTSPQPVLSTTPSW